MTVFTDDDLAELKELTKATIYWSPKIPDLLARLNAAEAYGYAMTGLFRDHEKIKALYHAWQKAAGKPTGEEGRR